MVQKISDDDRSSRTIIIIDGEMGSSILDIEIVNANAAQLFAAAGILEANARVALAGQMAQQEAEFRRPGLDIVRGGLPNEQRN